MMEVSREWLGGAAAGIEEVDPMRGTWRVRFGREEDEDGQASCMYAEYDHKPTDGEVIALVTGYYDDVCDHECEWGMRYKGLIVYLSFENKFNFKAAYDLALNTRGASLPITFKLWQDEKTPVYWAFRTLDELTDFYMEAMKHVTATLNKWWLKKDKELMRLVEGYKPLTRDKVEQAEKGGEP